MKNLQCPICKRTFETNHGKQVYCHKCLSFPETGKAVVYALCEVGSPDIRYIGSTTNPVKRFMEHRANGHGEEIKEWVSAIGGNLEMFILETVPASEAHLSEQIQITHYQTVGPSLLNKRAAASRIYSTEEAHDFISQWFAAE